MIIICLLCRILIYFMIINDVWSLNKNEHNWIISHYFKFTMQIECDYFKKNVEIWQQNDFEKYQFFCLHDNWCYYIHKLSDSACQFWFLIQHIREMILKWSQLKRQQELEQHFMSSNFDLWDSNDINVAEYYSFDSINNSDFKIENIMTADEKH